MPYYETNSGESGQYSAVSKSTFFCVRDAVASENAYEALPDAQKSPERKQNWNMLEANRFVIPNRFMFAVESNSAYSNTELIQVACDVIFRRLEGTIAIGSEKTSDTAIPNAIDVILKDTDHTIGKLIENEIFKMRDELGVTYVTFYKRFSHDSHGILRVATETSVGTTDGVSQIKNILYRVIEPIKAAFLKILKGPGKKQLHPQLAEALAKFRQSDLQGKRDRLIELGVPKNIVNVTEDEGLDSIAETYLVRVESSAVPHLLNMKEPEPKVEPEKKTDETKAEPEVKKAKKQKTKATKQGHEEQATKQGADEQATKQGTDEQATKQSGEEQATKQGADEQATKQSTDEQATKQGGEELATKQGAEEQATKQSPEEQATKQGADEQATKQKPKRTKKTDLKP